MNKRKKPKLQATLFWDTNPEKLDFEKHKDFIIVRVLMRGDTDDFLEIQNFYGTKTMIQAAKNAKYLDKKTLNFLSLIFDIPKKEFRCTKKPFLKTQKALWNR